MEKINFCSAMQPKSLKEFPEERCEFCADYYRAADVDALLAAARALVEAAKKYKEENGHLNYCNAIHGPEHETWTVEEDCNCELKPFKQAIAEVEPYIKEVRHIEEKD